MSIYRLYKKGVEIEGNFERLGRFRQPEGTRLVQLAESKSAQLLYGKRLFENYDRAEDKLFDEMKERSRPGLDQ